MRNAVVLCLAVLAFLLLRGCADLEPPDLCPDDPDAEIFRRPRSLLDEDVRLAAGCLLDAAVECPRGLSDGSGVPRGASQRGALMTPSKPRP